jgi:hypothetical protein
MADCVDLGSRTNRIQMSRFLNRYCALGSLLESILLTFGTTASPLAVARAAYRAYVDKDRVAIEALIADDYHFTSPIDNSLDRETYFEVCWPNSSSMTGFDYIYQIEDWEPCLHRLRGRTDSGKSSTTARCIPSGMASLFRLGPPARSTQG